MSGPAQAGMSFSLVILVAALLFLTIYFFETIFPSLIADIQTGASATLSEAASAYESFSAGLVGTINSSTTGLSGSATSVAAAIAAAQVSIDSDFATFEAFVAGTPNLLQSTVNSIGSETVTLIANIESEIATIGPAIDGAIGNLAYDVTNFFTTDCSGITVF